MGLKVMARGPKWWVEPISYRKRCWRRIEESWRERLPVRQDSFRALWCVSASYYNYASIMKKLIKIKRLYLPLTGLSASRRQMVRVSSGVTMGWQWLLRLVTGLKKCYFESEGARPKKETGAPGGYVTPLRAPKIWVKNPNCLIYLLGNNQNLRSLNNVRLFCFRHTAHSAAQRCSSRHNTVITANPYCVIYLIA